MIALAAFFVIDLFLFVYSIFEWLGILDDALDHSGTTYTSRRALISMRTCVRDRSRLGLHALPPGSRSGEGHRRRSRSPQADGSAGEGAQGSRRCAFRVRDVGQGHRGERRSEPAPRLRLQEHPPRLAARREALWEGAEEAIESLADPEERRAMQLCLSPKGPKHTIAETAAEIGHDEEVVRVALDKVFREVALRRIDGSAGHDPRSFRQSNRQPLN
jgi:hypothetical protein